jgi:membrane-bound serine protease (ClpP class)
MLLMVSVFMRARKKPVTTGVEQLLHETAIALSDFDTSGWVYVHSETWRAVTRSPIKKGQRLRVLRVDGLTLEVAPEE